jgi:flagellar FliL protein
LNQFEEGNTVSANPKAAEPAEGEKAPAKSKKMLIIIAAVVVLALGGGGAFFFMKKSQSADEEGGDAPPPKKAAAHAAGPKTPPVYLPLDNMVVNLADPGGERVAQIGVTLEVVDAKASETVKAFLPTIRSGVLMLVSRRTAEELLSREGKEKLALDILKVTTLPFGGEEDDEEEAPAKKAKAKKKVQVEYPVVGVLFSSFIVQ